MSDQLSNLKLSWFLFILGIICAVLNQVILMAAAGGLAQYYRNKVGDRKPPLNELISFHPLWKWFTVIYYLIASVLSLHYMGHLSNIGAAQFILLGMFPIIIPWFRYDYLLFKKLQEA